MLDTVAHTAEENAERVLAYLVENGFVRPALSDVGGDEKGSALTSNA